MIIDIDRLAGNMKDYEQDLYLFIQSVIEKGFYITNIPEHNLSNSFLQKFEKGHTQDLLGSTLKEIGLEAILKTNNSRHSLRDRIFGPFYNRILTYDDLLRIRYFPKENKIFIKKISSGVARISEENSNQIFDTNKYMEANTLRAIDYLKFLSREDQKVTKSEASCLAYFGIITMEEFELKSPKSISKGRITSPDLSKRISLFCQNFRWPINYDFVKPYQFSFPFKIHEIDHTRYKKNLIKWDLKNRQFWGKEEIHYSVLMDQVLKHGIVLD